MEELASDVDIPRVFRALTRLGYSGESSFDRVVVPAHDYIATVWIHHMAPLSLVVDTELRVPVELDHASALAEFLDGWNQERIGPSASYALTGAGNLLVRTRQAAPVKCGMTDAQLLSFLTGAFHMRGAFSDELHDELSLDDDPTALPATLLREQDHEALHRRSPQARHLPDDDELPVLGVPELADIWPDEPVEAFTLEHLVESLDLLDFTYEVGSEDIVATAVNGVGFALCVDGGVFFRITGGWITDFDPADDFLDVWLALNDHNEKAVATNAYTRSEGGAMLIHVEAALDVSQGTALDQRSNFVITSMVNILSAMDSLSRQTSGASIVEWPA